jgi:phenylalanyl-tRNA synthetase beta chain
MVSLGQPTHMFDYDEIKDGKIIMRESKKGEKLVTLDEKEFELPGGDIVIEDGSGRLIDFCGIMGGLNSSITEKTTNVLFFVQTYDKRKIRKSSMTTGQRTMAATYFEKGVDTERVEPTFVYGTKLLTQYTGAIGHSELKDIYPHKPEEKKLTISLHQIQNVMGVTIDEHKTVDILNRLGFTVEKHQSENHEINLHVTVPSYRLNDVKIKEDIIEEVARVYGYHNLPNTISPMVYLRQPSDIEEFFALQHKVKYLLKHAGLTEVMNYSMISGELIDRMNLNRGDHLKLANTISTEIEYMRLSEIQL